MFIDIFGLSNFNDCNLEISTLYDNNSINSNSGLSKLYEEFKIKFENSSLNIKNPFLYDDKYYFAHIFKRYNLKLEQSEFVELLKCLFKCLKDDPGYIIVKLLFPETIFLMLNAIQRDLKSSVKITHILLTYIVFQIQFNFNKIKEEVERLKNEKSTSLFDSKYLCYFIYKIRLDVSVLIFNMTGSVVTRKYFIFLAFLSFTRFFYPEEMKKFLTNEIFCANLCNIEYQKYYIKKYINLKYDYTMFPEKIKLDTFLLTETFLSNNFRNSNDLIFQLNGLGYLKSETYSFKIIDYQKFIGDLEKESFMMLCHFLETLN